MAPAPASTAATPKVSLRERKKIKTREAIRHAAYRLFEEQGYDATTVEQIAAAAEVSPSTFFRYFPTKEDVVLTDEYDPLMEAALRARPAGEPILDSFRNATVELFREMFEQDAGEIKQRMLLVLEVPAIRARMSEQMAGTCARLVAVFTERAGLPPDDLETRVLVGAMLGGWQEALLHWMESGAPDNLPDLLDRTLTMMQRGLGQR